MARLPVRCPFPARLLALGLAGLSLACGGSPSPPREPLPPASRSLATGSFSGERAWETLEALVAIGPRPPGSPAADAARRTIREAVEAAGLEAEVLETAAERPGAEPLVLRHLVATVPGAAPDRFVFLAPYDGSRGSGAPGVAASGAALLVELARVFADRRPPYALRFVWLEGEARAPAGARPAEAEGAPRASGSQSLARLWSESGELDRIRLLVAFERVCDADLEIARDLMSYRWHREEFWKAAARLGRTEVFPRGRGFETFDASHLAFRELGVRPVVAIVGTPSGGPEAADLREGDAEDALARCAPESIEAVGAVAVEVIETIGERLARIDRFTRAPSAPPEDEASP